MKLSICTILLIFHVSRDIFSTKFKFNSFEIEWFIYRPAKEITRHLLVYLIFIWFLMDTNVFAHWWREKFHATNVYVSIEWQTRYISKVNFQLTNKLSFNSLSIITPVAKQIKNNYILIETYYSLYIATVKYQKLIFEVNFCPRLFYGCTFFSESFSISIN